MPIFSNFTVKLNEEKGEGSERSGWEKEKEEEEEEEYNLHCIFFVH